MYIAWACFLNVRGCVSELFKQGASEGADGKF